MKILLDTHVLIWFAEANKNLGVKSLELLEDANNSLYISSISVWELMLLAKKERLKLSPNPESWLNAVVRSYQINHLAITSEIAIISFKLKFKHEDPADRLIASTAFYEKMTLLTADDKLLKINEINCLNAKK